jgi:undecaprenyl-diphosphatase
MLKKLKITLGSNSEDFFAPETINKFDGEFYIALSLLAISSFLIFILTQYIFFQTNNLIDYNVFLLIRQMTNPEAVKIAGIVTILGTGNFLIPSYILILAYLTKRNCTCLIYKTFTTAFGGLLLGWLLKWIFHRSRPLEHLVGGAGGFSFPSGHALGGFIFCGIVIYLVWKMKFSYFIRWICSVIFSILGFLIGMSRIYLHVHYATDVLGSFFIAIWWLLLMHILFKVFFKNPNYIVNDKLTVYQAL